MKAVLLASFFATAAAGPQTPLSLHAIKTYGTSTDCSATVAMKAVNSVEGCSPYASCCYCSEAGGPSRKWTEDSTTGLTQTTYANTCDCSGTATATTTQAWDTCAVTGISSAASVKTEGLVSSTDVVYGFFSSSTCGNFDATGLTKFGVYSRSKVTTSGACSENEPANGMSTKVTWDITASPPTLKTEIFGSAGCTGTAAATIAGEMGQCKQIDQGTATVLTTSACTDASACYVWVFPLGVFNPAAASASATTDIALTVAGAAAGAAAALLL